MSAPESFPRQSARTRRFSLGAPRSLSIRAGGRRVLFLRAMSGDDPRTGLWCVDLPDGEERLVVDPRAEPESELPEQERARRERVRETAAGVVAYSADTAGSVAVFAAGGALHAVDVESATVRELPAAAGVYDPHLDPTGRRVAYVSDRSLRVLHLGSGDDRTLVESATEGVFWGRAEHVAGEEMGRARGFWCAPDGESLLVAQVDERPVRTWWIADPAHPERPPSRVAYPAAGTPNAVVTLHHVLLDGSSRQVRWDIDAFPYLARVAWQRDHPPLVQVQSRDQRRVRTLSVDTASGDTTVVAEDIDPV